MHSDLIGTVWLGQFSSNASFCTINIGFDFRSIYFIYLQNFVNFLFEFEIGNSPRNMDHFEKHLFESRNPILFFFFSIINRLFINSFFESISFSYKYISRDITTNQFNNFYIRNHFYIEILSKILITYIDEFVHNSCCILEINLTFYFSKINISNFSKEIVENICILKIQSVKLH